MRNVIVISVFSLVGFTACKLSKAPAAEVKEAYDDKSNPFTQLDSTFLSDYTQLNEKEKMLTVYPWPDTYWPGYQGGISARWNRFWVLDEETEVGPSYKSTQNPTTKEWSPFKLPVNKLAVPYHFWWVNDIEDKAEKVKTLANKSLFPDYSTQFDYKLNTIDDLKKMTTEQIGMLSPAEKLDIVNQKINPNVPGEFYPTVELERKRTNPINPRWWGICDGWSLASISYPKEPNPKIFRVNLPTGGNIDVPFASSDIKAILSMFAKISAKDFKMVGRRCDIDLEANPQYKDSPNCKGLNAGSFHITLLNTVAKKDKSLVLQLNRHAEIWNHPVVGYKIVEGPTDMSDLGAKPAPGTVKRVRYKTSVHYRIESMPYAEAHGNKHFIKTKTFEYALEIDAKNNIIGGEWLNYDVLDYNVLPTTVPGGTPAPVRQNKIADRPGFYWIQSVGDMKDYKDYSIMSVIYNASIDPNPSVGPIPLYPTIDSSEDSNPSASPDLSVGAPQPTPIANQPVVGIDDTWLRIENKKSKLCLEVFGGLNADHIKIVQAKCTPGIAHKMIRHNSGTGTFEFKESGKCMTVSKTMFGTPALQQFPCGGMPGQGFVFNSDKNGAYTIRLASDLSMCLSIQGGSNMIWARANMAKCSGLDSQLFSLIKVDPIAEGE